VTGVEVIDITGIDTDGSAASVGTLTVSAAAFANDNTFKITGDSAVDDIFKVVNTGSAGTTIDASNITFDSTQAAKLVLQGKNSTTSTVIQDTITGSSKNDTIVATTGGDIMDGGAGTDTLDLSGLDNVANVEGTSTGTTTGVVLNLGATAVTNTAILTATGDYTADSVTSVSGGTLAYLFNASASTNSAVTGTVSNIETVIGSDLGDYIVASSGGTTITGGTGNDYLVGGVGVDTFGGLATANQSTAASANTFTAGGNVAGETITFGNGVDVISGFTSGSDKLDGTTATTLPTTLIGIATAAALTDGTAYVAYGTYTAATGVFTTAAAFNATTAKDAIVVEGDGVQTIVNEQDYVVLTGLNQALVAADFA
jgi:hypothetical protein